MPTDLSQISKGIADAKSQADKIQAGITALNAPKVAPPPVTPPPVTTPPQVTTPPVPPPPPPVNGTTLAQDQAKAQNQGKAGFDALGNPIPGYQPPSAPVTTSGTTYTPDKTGMDAINQKLLADKEQGVRNAEAFNKTQNDILNGVIPLTPGQQAQINGLTAQFQQMITQQELTNKGATGLAATRGYQTGSAEYDPNFHSGIIGSIASAGASKVLDYQTKLATAVAALTSSFQSDNITAAKSAYETLKNAQDEYDKALTDYSTNVSTAIKDANKTFYDTVTKPIQDIATDAAKNGASSKTLQAIRGSTNVQDALSAAGDSLQTATGTLGDYLQYKRDAEGKGLVPDTYGDYKDKQDAKALKAKVAEAYAVQNAKNLADASSGKSDKTQQGLEQQGRQIIAKEFSARTGALGVENSKVNQANHLNALFQQYYDPKTGNYNIPSNQYNEIAIGLANLVAGSGQAGERTIDSINAATLKGDFNHAIQYALGVPMNGNTQAMIKNALDSVDRQAETAVRNRETALQNMRDLLPTDLEQSRKDSLIKATNMVGYEGEERLAKSTVDNYVKANPKEASMVSQLFLVPGATNKDVQDYLIANGKDLSGKPVTTGRDFGYGFDSQGKRLNLYSKQ